MPIKQQSVIAETLSQRVSVLQRDMNGGAVDDAHLKIAIQAGMSAPDHGAKRPYRFAIASGDDAKAFYHNLIERAVAQGKSRDTVAETFKGVTTYILIFADIQDGRIPDYEQEWATVAATQNISNVLYDYGYAVKWNSILKESYDTAIEHLKCPPDWVCLGYLMVSQADNEHFAPKPRPDASDYTYRFSGDGVGNYYFQ